MENLNDIWIFTAVVEQKSFSTAARALGLSPSFVSKRVHLLEESLQIQLLNRSTHFLRLTDAGRIFYEQCAEPLQQLSGARDAALNSAKQMQGQLRIFSGIGFGEYVLWKLVAEFSKKFPQVVVNFEVGHRAINVLEKEFDIVIHSMDLPDSSLDHRKLGLLRYHLCAAPSYLKNAGMPESPRDLPKFNCMIHTAHRPADKWDFLDEAGKVYTVEINGSIISNSGITVYGACESGVGFACVPAYIAVDAIKSGRLVEIFPGQLKYERVLKAFSPRMRHASAKTKVFLDFIVQHLRTDLGMLDVAEPATQKMQKPTAVRSRNAF